MARVELPREENRGCLQNLVGFLEISAITLQLLDALLLGGGDTGGVLGIDLSLQNPLA
ncbi:hypothetical protein [Mycobacterium sp. AT1]|uniref:hypothetical protein n=1 Tax=Mycobacterium sp. AT1 TaxID=1961706 RepID=UPI001301D567|nr:hypothetical protein [Mycobacterium sp. AT1]